MAGFVAETWKDIKGNAKWDIIKWLFGGSVIATAIALVRAASVYWRMQILIFVLSVLGFAAISFYQRAQAHKRTREALVDKEDEKLVIHSAVYGTGPIDDMDVTHTLRTAVRDALVVPVDNNLVPRDPAIGKVKRIAVEYSYGNPSIQQATALEGERLVLPEDSALPRLRSEVEQLKRQHEQIAPIIGSAELLAVRLELKGLHIDKDWGGVSYDTGVFVRLRVAVTDKPRTVKSFVLEVRTLKEGKVQEPAAYSVESERNVGDHMYRHIDAGTGQLGYEVEKEEREEMPDLMSKLETPLQPETGREGWVRFEIKGLRHELSECHIVIYAVDVRGGRHEIDTEQMIVKRVEEHTVVLAKRPS